MLEARGGVAAFWALPWQLDQMMCLYVGEGMQGRDRFVRMRQGI